MKGNVLHAHNETIVGEFTSVHKIKLHGYMDVSHRHEGRKTGDNLMVWNYFSLPLGSGAATHCVGIG
jgi:hypothetical protein